MHCLTEGVQLPPCPGALSASALRAGALALAPTCTGPRIGWGAGQTRRPVRFPALSWGGARGVFGHFFAESQAAFLLNQTGKACRVEGGKRAAEGARKKKQKREKEAKSAAATAPEEGSESDKKPLGRPPGRKDAAKRVRRTEAEQQRDAAVTAGLVNALGGTQPPQKPEQLVLDGREPRGGEKRKQLFVAALFASFVCCSQMTNRSLRSSTQFI